MEKRIVKLLEKAIDIWFDRAEGKMNTTSCPLCKISTGCSSCPVYQKTGTTQCWNTPYRKWISAGTTQEKKAEARKEVNFLISLLPKKLQRPYWYD